MRLSVTLLGLDLLSIEVTTDQSDDGPGDCTTMPVGFTASHGDQRWERGADL